MQSQEFVFDPRPNYPLLVTAKRLRDASSPYANDPTAYTLVFLHATGFHKEIWEPIVDDLLVVVKNKGGEQLRIREIWLIDSPNHGDAAILNEETLSWGYDLVFGWEQYGRAVHSLLAGLGKGIDTDFSEHRLIGVGHSMGAASVTLSMNFFPKVKFEALVLVEIMAWNKKLLPGGWTVETNFLARGAANRRDIWASKEDAYQVFKSRPAWKVWDDRMLRVYVDKGLRPLPTREYPDKEGVTLKCTRKQETVTFLSSDHSFVYRDFHTFAKRVPIHLMFGAVDDYIPREVKDDIIENAIGGMHHLASFQRIPGGGHLAPQTHPTGVAKAIYNALTGNVSPESAKL
ncbi:hypothetical protein PQX77_016600 [Marasmius sp. AFHP31]|nr:hypothetical protein PQX77_016600 [Marasmius sp. AFHP31]